MLKEAGLDRRNNAAEGLDPGKVCLRFVFKAVCHRFHKVAAAKGIDRVGHTRLTCDKLLRPQSNLHGLLGRQGQRFIHRIRMQRLGSAKNPCEGLQRRPHDIILGLLPGQRAPGCLRMKAKHHRTRILRTVLFLHPPGPDPARGPVLRDLLEKIQVRIEKERQARGEIVHFHSPLEARFHVCEAVGQRERQLLRRRRTGLPDVVPADRNGIPLWHFLRAKLNHVGHDPHGGTRRIDPFLLRNILFQDIGLHRSAQGYPRRTLFLGNRGIHRQHHRGRRVDRHRRGDVSEGDSFEEYLHVGQRTYRHTANADLSLRRECIRIVPHEGGKIKRHREPRLSMGQQVVVAFVGILRRPKSGELAHRPHFPTVPCVVNSPRIGKFPRVPDLRLIRPRFHILRGVQKRDRFSAHRRVVPLLSGKTGSGFLPRLSSRSRTLPLCHECPPPLVA